MNPNDIISELQRIAGTKDFVLKTEELTRTWTEAKIGAESIDPVLRFMESNPDLDLGSPGPLVPFVEKFLGRGYEQKLFDSVRRKPTVYTIWMLKRLYNWTQDPVFRNSLVVELRTAKEHPLADSTVVDQVNRFFEKRGG
jgi:hypothetical protein